MHIARIDFKDFYRPAFGTAETAHGFVERALATPLDVSPAQRILRQAARMIWLGDRLDTVAKGRPALQVLFYLIAAEASAKLLYGFAKEGKCREHVRLFFEQICSDEHRARLVSGFRLPHHYANPPLRAVVDLLYVVRCDVAHEGRYFEFQMQEAGEPPCTSIVGGKLIEARMSILDLRQLVLEGAVRAVEQSIPPQAAI
jgi:hypothetical protein